MAECPKCGAMAANPIRTWSLVGRPSKKGERFKITIGLYECSTCEKKFRVVLERERVTIKGLIREIKGVEKGLTQTLENLREKIEKLENEKTDLLTEIKKFRRAGEEKASALEKEIAALRKEAKSLEELLSSPE